MKMDLNISGLKELTDDFNLLTDIEKRRVSKNAVRASAVVFRDAVKNSTPVNTGALKRSVSVYVPKGRDAIAGVRFNKVRIIRRLKNKSEVKKQVPFYWWFLEYGTSTMPAQPFLRQAFDSNVEKATQAGMKRYEVEIDKVFSR